MSRVQNSRQRGNLNLSIYLKPEESPEDRWFCVVNNMMSPYDLYEILSGFLFLVCKFSNLSNVYAPPISIATYIVSTSKEYITIKRGNVFMSILIQ